MTFKVVPGPTFQRQIARILKKYPKFKSELKQYLLLMEKQGPMGKRWPNMNYLWKDRLAIKAYNIGKRGGVRLITYHDRERDDQFVAPLLAYLKSEMPNPPHKMIIEAVKETLEYLNNLE